MNLLNDGAYDDIKNVKCQYKIISPDNPVIGVIGKGVILPCQLKVNIIPERLSVQWIFTGDSPKIDVTTYDGKNTYNPVREDYAYQGRTNFFQSEFKKGNLSLHLKNVVLSDKGKYTCSVFYENWYDEVVVDLHVAAKSDESSVFLDGHVGQGISLTCKSQGWFPEPQIVWLNSTGQTRKEKVTTQAMKTSSGVFDVVSSMTLEPGSDKEVSCRVVNNLLNAMCESRVLISDFWEARSHAVPITVNADCQVLELQVPGAPDVGSNTSEPAVPNAASTVPVLVGKAGFSAGKHYWEVDVGQQQDWVLGVLRKTGRPKEEEFLPGEHYWALHRSQGDIFSSEGDHRIAKQQMSDSVIGVHVELEKGQVSFYEAKQMGIMGTFKRRQPK
nr:PREDICTED: butyrophilin subfamily 3 member A2-like [Opisthocomus hoazin]